jgi:hypothetical protein
MVRVEVHNFQSIQDGVVDIDGFSVVVGRSNIGKSALVRAIKAALTGAPADNYVRHGFDCQRISKGSKSCKCFCSVRIQGPDVDLLWEKGDSVNRYVYNGTEHTVVGKGQPEFLGPAFAPIQIGGDTTPTLLQVADQFRPLFILDRSGTAVADVLSDVAKLDQINEASRAAERDRRECASTRKIRDKDLKELDHTIALYDGLDAVVARVKAVEAMDEAVAVLETNLRTLDRLALALATVGSSIRALTPVEKVEIRPPAKVVEQAARLGALTLWQDSLQAKLSALTSLKKAAEVPISEVSGITFLARGHSELERWTAQLVAIKAVFARFKVVEVTAVPETAHLTALHSSYRRVSDWSEKLVGLQGAVARLEKLEATAEVEEAAILAEFKALEVCPTCRQPIQISAHAHEEIAYA